MEIATAIVAVYAALVATGALAWQIYSWWHRRQSRVKVTASLGHVGHANGAVEAVIITAINRSEYPVNVQGLGFDMQDGSSRTLALFQPMPGSSLPGRIEANDSGWAWTGPEQAESGKAALDLSKQLLISLSR
jgi:hypothetical protein